MLSRTNCGFTLIEILVALLVVTITVSVVLGSQLVSLKVEQKARVLQLYRFETERIFSVTHHAKNEQELMQLLATNNLCRVKSEKIQMESGTNVVTFLKHELNTDQSAIAPNVKRLRATGEALPSSSLRSPEALHARDEVGFSSVFFVHLPDYPRQNRDAAGP